MKNFLLVLSLVSAVSALAADPVVSNVVLAKAADGSVTVTYDLSETGVVTAEIVADGVTVDGTSNGLIGDVFKEVKGGTGRSFAWHPEWTWKGHSAANVIAKLQAWRLDNPPDYMVVNLISGAVDRVYYYPSTNFFPGGILADEKYRITMMPFKKIKAKGIEWQMGTVSETGRTTTDEREKAHKVTLQKNFYMAVFQFTKGQATSYGNSRQGDFDTADRWRMVPDNRRSWNSLRGSQYPGNTPSKSSPLGKLSALVGFDFDLPLESEWEFTARGGHGEGYWGDGSKIKATGHDTNLDRLAAYKYSSDPAATAGSYLMMPVGTFRPNDYGIYDMGGNVQEYCQDWYQLDITGLGGALCVDPNDHSKRPDGTTGANVVAKGTPYYGSSASGARPSVRSGYARGNTYTEKGARFRTYANLGDIGDDPAPVPSTNAIAVDTLDLVAVPVEKTNAEAFDWRAYTVFMADDFTLDTFPLGLLLFIR